MFYYHNEVWELMRFLSYQRHFSDSAYESDSLVIVLLIPGQFQSS